MSDLISTFIYFTTSFSVKISLIIPAQHISLDSLMLFTLYRISCHTISLFIINFVDWRVQTETTPVWGSGLVWRYYVWLRPLAHSFHKQHRQNGSIPHSVLCMCPCLICGKGRSGTFHNHWQYQGHRVIFSMMTVAKINTASETCRFTPWTFALIHCLRIFQGDPSLLTFPSGPQQAGPESHVHCCHHGLGLWPGTKWLCLAGASPCPRAGHDVMDTVVSSRVLCPVDQDLINSPLFSSIPPSTIS